MNSQKIALFAGPGEASVRLASEALRRGHTIIAMVPDEKQFNLKHPNLKVVKGDVKKTEDVSRFAVGNDVVISTHHPSKTHAADHWVITRSLIEGTKQALVHHLVSVAHPFGMPTETTEEFYNEFKPILKAQGEALVLFRKEKDIHWGYVHTVQPRAEDLSKLQQGRNPRYTFSDEILFTHPEGENRVLIRDYASAILDEAEKGELELHEHGEEGENTF